MKSALWSALLSLLLLSPVIAGEPSPGSPSETGQAQAIADKAGVPVEEVIARRKTGKGWGQIAQDYGFKLGDAKRAEKSKEPKARREPKAEKEPRREPKGRGPRK